MLMRQSLTPSSKSSSSSKSFPKYELIHWFPLHKLDYWFISENPNAIDFLSLPNNKHLINCYMLSNNTNPKAIKLLKECIKKNELRDWTRISANQNAIKILTLPENYNYIKWDALSSNLSPKAIDFLLSEENINNINYKALSSNPCINAVNYLIENVIYIDWKAFSKNTNPKAINLIIKKIKEEGEPFIKKLDWNALSENPAIFNHFNKYKKARGETIERILSSNLPTNAKAKIRITDLNNDVQQLIKEYSINLVKNELKNGIPIGKLNWSCLCKNPEAIDLLSLPKNYDNIDWGQLSKNSEAIDLLTERMIFENNLSNKDYNKLLNKINWLSLSENPNAIGLLSLEENYDKIFWSMLSKNPKAIKLLEERVKYELSLNEDQLNNIEAQKRINWNSLLKNPAIFVTP